MNTINAHGVNVHVTVDEDGIPSVFVDTSALTEPASKLPPVRVYLNDGQIWDNEKGRDC